MKTFVVLCLFFIYKTVDAELPDFLKACKNNDPDDFNDCLADNLNAIWDQTKTGKGEFAMESYDPLRFTPVNLNRGEFNLIMIPAIYNMENLTIEEPSIDWADQSIQMALKTDEIIWKGPYGAGLNNGPVVQRDEGIINFRQRKYYPLMYAILHFNVTTKNDGLYYNGKQYLNITQADVALNSKTDYKFPKLDNTTNLELRTAWENVKNSSENKEFAEVFEDVIKGVFQNVFEKVPIKEIFPDN